MPIDGLIVLFSIHHPLAGFSSAKNLSDPHSLECLQQRIVDVCLCPLTDLPIETELLKRIELNSKREIGVVVLQEHANQERILDLINMLEQA